MMGFCIQSLSTDPSGGYCGVDHTGHVLFEHAEVLVDALALHPDVRIVLSASWVRVLGFSQAKAHLLEALRSRLIGATFHSPMNKFEFDAMTRSVQVLAGADDDDEGWTGTASRQHLVRTHGHKGLSEPNTVDDLLDKLRSIARRYDSIRIQLLVGMPSSSPSSCFLPLGIGSFRLSAAAQLKDVKDC